MYQMPQVHSSHFNRLLDYVRERDGEIVIRCKDKRWTVAVHAEDHATVEANRNFAIACRDIILRLGA